MSSMRALLLLGRDHAPPAVAVGLVLTSIAAIALSWPRLTRDATTIE
jgi:hypothetical protein